MLLFSCIFFLRRIVLCAILLYLSIVVVIVAVVVVVLVSVWVFYTYLYCRHLWNFNSHFCCCLAVAFTLALSECALSRSLEDTHTTHTYAHTDTTCSRTRKHQFIACERALRLPLTQCALRVSLSLTLVHIEHAHILLFRHLRQKQKLQGWWHNISFDSVAISAVSAPIPCITFSAFVFVLFCVGVALAAPVRSLACRLQHVRFPVYFLSIAAAASTRRQTKARGKVKAGNHMHDLTHTVS